MDNYVILISLSIVLFLFVLVQSLKHQGSNILYEPFEIEVSRLPNKTLSIWSGDINQIPKYWSIYKPLAFKKRTYQFSKKIPPELTILDNRVGQNRGPEKGLGGKFRDREVDYVAVLNPPELSEGLQIKQFKYDYYETGHSHGAGIELRDNQGQVVTAVGTDNPQLDTLKKSRTNGPGYNVWVRVEIKFDWSNQQVEFKWTNLDKNRELRTSKEKMETPSNVSQIWFVNQNRGFWKGTTYTGGSFYHTYDNIEIDLGRQVFKNLEKPDSDGNFPAWIIKSEDSS